MNKRLQEWIRESCLAETLGKKGKDGAQRIFHEIMVENVP